MSMNFLNGIQTRQLKESLVKGFRFSQRLSHENRFPVNIIPEKIFLFVFFFHMKISLKRQDLL